MPYRSLQDHESESARRVAGRRRPPGAATAPPIDDADPSETSSESVVGQAARRVGLSLPLARHVDAGLRPVVVAHDLAVLRAGVAAGPGEVLLGPVVSDAVGHPTFAWDLDPNGVFDDSIDARPSDSSNGQARLLFHDFGGDGPVITRMGLGAACDGTRTWWVLQMGP